MIIFGVVLYLVGVFATLVVGLVEMWFEADFVNDKYLFDEEAYNRGKYLAIHAIIFPWAIYKILHKKFSKAEERLKGDQNNDS